MPAMEVDLALLVPDAVVAARWAARSEKLRDLLESLVLFDEFGGRYSGWDRSLAWRLNFRHLAHTTDREIQGRTAKI